MLESNYTFMKVFGHFFCCHSTACFTIHILNSASMMYDCFNYNHDVIIQKSKDQILYTNLYIVSTFMFKGTVYKVPYLTHLYIFTLSPQNNQAPFFLYISPKGIPFLKTLTWSNIIKHHTKYMTYFFKRIKFRYYLLICISSPLVWILYRKGDNIQISILICISSPLL